jgi:hypothetical protein
MLTPASELGELASLEAVFAAKLLMVLNHALTTLVRTFGLLRHSLPPTGSLAEIRYAKFFLATSEYREVARSIFQNVAPKFFSLVCSDPENHPGLIRSLYVRA